MPPWATEIAIVIVVLLIVVPLALKFLIGLRFISNTEVGIVEKTWGGGHLTGQIIALNNEAGFQPEVLRGGIHFKPGYRYRIHRVPLVTIHRGHVGYVFARDGQPLGRYMQDGKEVVEAGQTLGHVVNNGDFSDCRAWLKAGGQKGPQRAILREGTYAINLAQYVVICGPKEIYYHPIGGRDESLAIQQIAEQIAQRDGFSPIVIDGSTDQIGIVTVHDGPSLRQGDIIAPTVGDSKTDEHYHNNFQDPQAFLSAGGFRGRQYQVLSEGTYWINRLFATVELKPKTHVQVGEVGVVVSYYGERGEDVSGVAFRHGEMCKKGGRGIWDEALLPGKYAFNPYAGEVIMVPTVNIILKWIAADTGEHKLDASLREIGLITKDAFEPELPLSVVINIDYQKAPNVIQRFGSVKSLIEQSLDPLVSSYFKNQGQQRTLIELIQARSEIQEVATKDMKARFLEYDLGLQEVLIGTPHSQHGDTQIETILNQLRERQVAVEQRETYKRQEEAQAGLRSLNEAKATASRQTDLTDSKVQIEIEVNQADAAAQRAEKDAQRNITIAEADARQTVLRAEADAKQTVMRAKADSERTVLLANAEAESKARVQIAEALGIREVRKAYGSSGLMVKQKMIGQIADALKDTKHPLVPHSVVTMGHNGNGVDGDGGGNMLTQMLTLLLTDKLGLTDVKDDQIEDDMGPEAKAFLKKIMTGFADGSAAEPALAMPGDGRRRSKLPPDPEKG
ncbi:MAG TPA: SPFH domain-containing protein [Fimbriimonadaceae bacterium]|nr:SPFH domain-containing protein [Fimbriimonadaceae bacterium]